MTNHAEMSDAALVEATRAGDSKAFGELWNRHHKAAVAAARSITSKFDADDLAQESFAAILTAIQKGKGPATAFRAYLLTAVRNTAAKWGRANRELADDQLDLVSDPQWDEEETQRELNRSVTATAFRSLPTRWQEVLWYTEVEQMKPAAVAPLLGMKPVAVAQLAFRAREGLREAWIQAHLRSLSEDSDCHWVVERLGAHARENSSKRDKLRIDAHLMDCARCMIVFEEASTVGSQLGSAQLGTILVPLFLGATGAAGYLAWVQHGAVIGTVGGTAAAAPAEPLTMPAHTARLTAKLGLAAAAVVVAAVAITSTVDASISGGSLAAADKHPRAAAPATQPAPVGDALAIPRHAATPSPAPVAPLPEPTLSPVTPTNESAPAGARPVTVMVPAEVTPPATVSRPPAVVMPPPVTTPPITMPPAPAGTPSSSTAIPQTSGSQKSIVYTVTGPADQPVTVTVDGTSAASGMTGSDGSFSTTIDLTPAQASSGVTITSQFPQSPSSNISTPVGAF